jgi:hypothetical protein
VGHAGANTGRMNAEFQRRCAQFDKKYPENNLLYFPTEEEWTLTPRPNRLQLAEKFPANYAVSAYPQPGQNEWIPGNRVPGQQRKHKVGKLPANQATMDCYLGPDNLQRSGITHASNSDHFGAAGETDTTTPFYNCDNTRDGEPTGWN